MLRNNDTTLQADLRKKSSIRDESTYSSLDFQTCMVMLIVMAALLLSVVSVVAAQSSVII